MQTLVGPALREEAPVETPAAAEATVLANVVFRGALPDGAVVQRLIRKFYGKRPWPLPPGQTIGLHFQAFSNDPVVRVRWTPADPPASAGSWNVRSWTKPRRA